MFVMNEDLSIYITRGDSAFFLVMASEPDGADHTFKAGDVLRLKVYGKKDAERVVLQKDFPIEGDTTQVRIALTEADTKIGDVISKPTDYWYEVELNPFTSPQTIIGYDEDGAKVFRLFPEGKDIPDFEPDPEDVRVIDMVLDMTSTRPVQNQAIARGLTAVKSDLAAFKKDATAKDNALHARMNDIAESVATEQARLDIIIAGSALEPDAEIADVRVGADGVTYDSAGTAVRNQIGVTKNTIFDAVNALGNDEILRCTLESGYISSTGSLVEASNTTKEVTTDNIPVKALEFFTVCVPKKSASVEHWCAVSYYDSAHNFISRTAGADETIMAMPPVDGFMRVSFRSYGYPYILIIRHNRNNVGDMIIADCHKTNYEYVKFDIVHGYYDYTGTYKAPLHYSRDIHTSYIPVKPGEKYVVSSRVKNTSGLDAGGQCHWIGVNVFDLNKNHHSRIATFAVTEESPNQLYTASAEFVIPTGAAYMVVSTRTYDECKLNIALVNESNEHNNSYSVVKGIAHRGFSTKAPENTLPAYRMAKKYGFTYVECDVSYTKDNVGVLLHDNTIDRTSNGSGNVGDFSLAELKAFDFGSWFSSDYIGTPVTTFEEFIALCRCIGLHPYIELKSGTQDQIVSLYKTVRDYGMLDKVTWISFTHWYLRWIRECYPKARLGFVCNNVTADVVSVAKDLENGENEVFIDTGSASDDEVTLCIENGLPLEFWTLNEESGVLWLHPYVSGVTSDCLIAGNVLYDANID